jgi:peptidoglycan/LPS O-acetylase OafA/YrhL
LLVCLYHFRVDQPFAESSFIANSWMFVDFFFVLSGFVIATGYQEKLAKGLTIREFMWRRLLRLYPLHIALMLAFAGFGLLRYFAGGSSGFEAKTIIAHLLFLNSTGGIAERDALNVPSWSIAAEFWTYGLYACVFAFVARPTWLIAVISFSAFVALFATTGLQTTTELGLLRCIGSFGLGAICRQLPKRVGGSGPEALSIVASAVIVTTGAHLVAPFVFAATLLVFASERGVLSSLLKRPALQKLGQWSFSIYMVHLFLQLRLMDAVKAGLIPGVAWHKAEFRGVEQAVMLAGPAFSIALYAGMIALVLGMSSLTYRFIEQPFFSRRSPVARKESTPSGATDVAGEGKGLW